MMAELYRKYLECSFRVTTDSRAVSGGEIFFALKGENFDGNRYAYAALEAGAAYAVVDDRSLPDDPRLIKVDDSFLSLRDLAAYHREHVGGDRRLPVIGLTGTNGKTTTKELIRVVLSCRYRVCATEGNLNNDVGVPLSILKITPDTQIAVIEMGANHPDDIAKLVQVSHPDYALITNVGRAHLLGFGSFEGVKAAKGELYKYVGNRDSSVIFINADNPDLMEMASGYACHRFEYGMRYQGVRMLECDADHPFLRLVVDGVEVDTCLVGDYNADNVLAAICIGKYFGVEIKEAAAAIASYVPSNNRSQMLETGSNLVIVDAYNANPSSMSASIDNFSRINSGKKLALLGDMRELGAESLNEHMKIVSKVKSYGIPAIYVGEEFSRALCAMGEKDAVVFPDSLMLASYLESEKVEGAVVLLKGSRGIMMEKAIPFL